MYAGGDWCVKWFTKIPPKTSLIVGAHPILFGVFRMMWRITVHTHAYRSVWKLYHFDMPIQWRRDRKTVGWASVYSRWTFLPFILWEQKMWSTTPPSLLDAIKRYLNTKGKTNLTLIRTARRNDAYDINCWAVTQMRVCMLAWRYFALERLSDADYGQVLYNSLLNSTEAYQQQVPSTCA